MKLKRILPIVLVLFLILGGVLAWAYWKYLIVPEKLRTEHAACSGRLRQIWQLGQQWAVDRQTTFPDSLHYLIEQKVDPDIVICPGDPSLDLEAINDWSELSQLSGSYLMVHPDQIRDQPFGIYIKCPIHRLGVSRQGMLFEF